MTSTTISRTNPGTTSNTGRRRLLTREAMAIGASTFTTILPGPALGKNGTVAPRNPIVMAGIGIGGQGTRDLTRFLGHQDVQFVAI